MKDQSIFFLMIILLILITYSLDNVLVSLGENWCRSALGLKRIEGAGARLTYLPPHSPDFNPLEELFSKLKSHILQNDIVFQATGSPEAFIVERFFNVS